MEDQEKTFAMKIEYIINKRNPQIDSEVPGIQTLREDGQRIDNVADTEIYKPVLTVTKNEKTFKKGDFKLQKVTVKEGIPSEENKRPMFVMSNPLHSTINAQVIPGPQRIRKDDKFEEIEDTKKEQNKNSETKIPIPTFRDTSKITHEEKEEKLPHLKNQERRSSLPKLKMPVSDNTKSAPATAVISPEIAFDKIYAEIVDNREEVPVIDSKILEEAKLDPAVLETSFEKLRHAYDENLLQPISLDYTVANKPSKIPLVRQKSEQLVNILPKAPRRRSLKSAKSVEDQANDIKLAIERHNESEELKPSYKINTVPPKRPSHKSDGTVKQKKELENPVDASKETSKKLEQTNTPPNTPMPHSFEGNEIFEDNSGVNPTDKDVRSISGKKEPENTKSTETAKIPRGIVNKILHRINSKDDANEYLQVNVKPTDFHTDIHSIYDFKQINTIHVDEDSQSKKNTGHKIEKERPISINVESTKVSNVEYKQEILEKIDVETESKLKFQTEQDTKSFPVHNNDKSHKAKCGQDFLISGETHAKPNSSIISRGVDNNLPINETLNKVEILISKAEERKTNTDNGNVQGQGSVEDIEKKGRKTDTKIKNVETTENIIVPHDRVTSPKASKIEKEGKITKIMKKIETRNENAIIDSSETKILKPVSETVSQVFKTQVKSEQGLPINVHSEIDVKNRVKEIVNTNSSLENNTVPGETRLPVPVKDVKNEPVKPTVEKPMTRVSSSMLPKPVPGMNEKSETPLIIETPLDIVTKSSEIKNKDILKIKPLEPGSDREQILVIKNKDAALLENPKIRHDQDIVQKAPNTSIKNEKATKEQTSTEANYQPIEKNRQDHELGKNNEITKDDKEKLKKALPKNKSILSKIAIFENSPKPILKLKNRSTVANLDNLYSDNNASKNKSKDEEKNRRPIIVEAVIKAGPIREDVKNIDKISYKDSITEEEKKTVDIVTNSKESDVRHAQTKEIVKIPEVLNTEKVIYMKGIEKKPTDKQRNKEKNPIVLKPDENKYTSDKPYSPEVKDRSPTGKQYDIPNNVVTGQADQNYKKEKQIFKTRLHNLKSIDFDEYKHAHPIDTNNKNTESKRDERFSPRTDLKRAKSIADLQLEDSMKGKVEFLIKRISSMDKLDVVGRKDVINARERPRRMSVSEKIALFERKLVPIKMEDENLVRAPTPEKKQDGAEKRRQDEIDNKIKELKKYGVIHKAVDNVFMQSYILNDGNKMPAIALGTALLEPALVKHVVECAIDVGYRAIDTAFIYGTEQAVGEAIRAKIQDGTVKREELFIITKLWSTFHRPDLVEKACLDSLNNLGLEYLDLFLIHNPMSFKEGVNPIPKIANVIQYSDYQYLDAWPAMEELKTKGFVKSIGVSNFNSDQLARILNKGKIKPAVNQVESHPYLSQERLSEFCSKRDILLSCYGVLGSKGTPAEYKNPGVTAVIEDEDVKKLADQLNMTPAQLLIRYQLERGHSVVVKSSTPRYLVDILGALNLKITDQDIDKLNGLNRNRRNFTFIGMGDTHRNYPFNAPF